jgi:hypothetical protein
MYDYETCLEDCLSILSIRFIARDVTLAMIVAFKYFQFYRLDSKSTTT